MTTNHEAREAALDALDREWFDRQSAGGRHDDYTAFDAEAAAFADFMRARNERATDTDTGDEA